MTQFGRSDLYKYQLFEKEIGRAIVEKQEQEGWGSKVLEKVTKDLQNEFPGIEGFSKRNVFRMRAFYKEYKIVPPPVAYASGYRIFAC